MNKEITIKYLHCDTCGEVVSTGFIPTDDSERGIVIFGLIECSECVEDRDKEEEN